MAPGLGQIFASPRRHGSDAVPSAGHTARYLLALKAALAAPALQDSPEAEAAAAPATPATAVAGLVGSSLVAGCDLFGVRALLGAQSGAMSLLLSAMTGNGAAPGPFFGDSYKAKDAKELAGSAEAAAAAERAAKSVEANPFQSPSSLPFPPQDFPRSFQPCHSPSLSARLSHSCWTARQLVVGDWRALAGTDAFPGRSAFTFPCDGSDAALRECHALALRKRCGGFTVVKGTAFFKAASPAALAKASLPSPEAALHVAPALVRPRVSRRMLRPWIRAPPPFSPHPEHSVRTTSRAPLSRPKP